MNYSIYNKSTGRIVRKVSCLETDLYLQYDPNIENYLEYHIDDTKNYICLTSGNVLTIPDQPSIYHEFNWDTKSWEDKRTSENEWYVIIQNINRFLTYSDWTQMPDVNIPTKEAWATYRQALRDITNQADPFNITWPTPPQ
jgi:hypothetical protein